MRMPPLPADSIHARACKLKCEKILTRPRVSLVCEHLVYIIASTSARYKDKKGNEGQVLKFHNTWPLL